VLIGCIFFFVALGWLVVSKSGRFFCCRTDKLSLG